MPKKKPITTPPADTTDATQSDRAFIAQLNREHTRRTEDIVRRMDAAREKLLIPEPENPLDMEDVDGIPITDPETGKLYLAQKGTPEYEAYLKENAEAIRIHTQWEQAEVNKDFIALRRELEQAQQDYSEKMVAYIERVKNAPSIGTRAAAEYVAPTDLISQRVFSGQLTSLPENIRISSPTAKKQAVTSISVDFEALESDTAVTGRKQLDRYTQAVYQAIIALWNAGNTIVSVGMIYSAMTGSDGKVPQKQADMINESIHTLMRSVVSINSSEEHNLRGYAAVKASYYGNLITAKAATVKIRGKRIDGAIQIFSAPILYEYAAAKHQIATGDIALLNAPINKTPENIMLIDYLRRRVDAMPDGKTDNKIRYAAIYEAIGLTGNDNTAKVKKRRTREYITKTLDYWKERGYIRDYAEYAKDGKAYAEGIKITLCEPPQNEPTEEE